MNGVMLTSSKRIFKLFSMQICIFSKFADDLANAKEIAVELELEAVPAQELQRVIRKRNCSGMKISCVRE